MDASHRNPFSQRRKRVIRRPSNRKRNQKGTTGQCRPNLQQNIKRNFPKDSKLFGQMDRVNEWSRDFRYCFGLSTGVCRDPSSAEIANSIQPVHRGGRVGGFGGRETSEEGGYRGGGTLQKSISFKHLHDTQEGWREEASGRHEGPEQFHRTCSFQNARPFALAINPLERGFYVQDRSARPISNHSNCKKSRIYLRFLWKGRLYQFTCLPFGLRSSPRIFTKVLKPLLVYLRALGVHLLVYLDNILIIAATPELYLEHTQLTWQLLTDLGFLGNLKKSVLTPKQQTEYLGFLMNSIAIKLFLMEEKLLRSKLEAQCLLKSNPVVKMLASFLGFCQSTLPAIALAPLHFRKLQADMVKAIRGLRRRQGYWSVVHLSPEAKTELEWWRDHLKMNDGKSIFLLEEQETIFTDASRQGWGGAHLNLEKIGGQWIWEEKVDTHINMLELKANLNFLKTWAPAESLSLKQLTLKLVAALITPSCSSCF